MTSRSVSRRKVKPASAVSALQIDRDSSDSLDDVGLALERAHAILDMLCAVVTSSDRLIHTLHRQTISRGLYAALNEIETADKALFRQEAQS